MADRVSATITLGGTLPAEQLPDLVATINGEGLSTEWGGEEVTLSQLATGGALTLMAHEVAGGQFDELEAFCLAEGLSFARWSGGYGGSWGAERVVFIGSGEPVSYTADEEDRILVDRGTVDRLGTIEAVLAHFDAAAFAVPPLRVQV